MLNFIKNKKLIFIFSLSLMCILLGIISNIYFSASNYTNTIITSNNLNFKNILIKQNFIDINNKNINPILHNKKTIIINFWASWCNPCIKEMPIINNFYQQHKQDITVIGIAIDNQENIQNFLNKYKIDYPIIVAANEGIELSKQAGNNLGVMPYTVVLDVNGNIKHKHIGELSEKQLLNLANNIEKIQ